MKKKNIISVIATMLCMVMLFTIPCDAAKYNYTSVVKTDDETIKTPDGTFKFTSMQGMAVGKKYAYTVKLPDNKTYKEKYACIVRTDVATGSKEEKLLTCNGNKYVPNLGHANDMCVTGINGKSNLFVAASYVDTKEGGSKKKQEYNLVRLTVTDTTLKQTGKYRVRKADGSEMRFSGITIFEHPGKSNNNTITFLFKEGDKIYTSKISANTTSGTIVPKLAYTFQKSNRKKFDYSSYTNQGFSYYNNKIYLPLSNGSNSVILVYNNVNVSNFYKHGIVQKLIPNGNLVFEISDTNYSKLLEIESCGICTQEENFKLYFNTNRRKADNSYNWDGIHFVDGYTAK